MSSIQSSQLIKFIIVNSSFCPFTQQRSIGDTALLHLPQFDKVLHELLVILLHLLHFLLESTLSQIFAPLILVCDQSSQLIALECEQVVVVIHQEPVYLLVLLLPLQIDSFLIYELHPSLLIINFSYMGAFISIITDCIARRQQRTEQGGQPQLNISIGSLRHVQEVMDAPPVYRPRPIHQRNIFSWNENTKQLDRIQSTNSADDTLYNNSPRHAGGTPKKSNFWHRRYNE